MFFKYYNIKEKLDEVAGILFGSFWAANFKIVTKGKMPINVS